MSPETYEAALAFLERSSVTEARLLGGEPTEHPRFCEYLSQALERSFQVMVFSGGLIPQQALDFLVDLPADSISVALNSADPAVEPRGLVDRQREVCRALGENVILGFNIISPDQDPTFLFDWVIEGDLCRSIRLGLAHPIWGGANVHYRLRGPRLIPLLERLVAKGTQLGVNVGFDCGFTPCLFSRQFVDAHADMFLHGNDGEAAPGLQNATCDDPAAQRVESIGVRCTPVVDILPEGDCIACYALSRFHRLPLPSEGNRSDLVRSFDDELTSTLPVGLHRECAQCGYRAQGMCGGGCRARRTQRLRPNAMALLDPEPTYEVDLPPT